MKGIMQMKATVISQCDDNDNGDADGDNDDQQCGGYDDDDTDLDADKPLLAYFYIVLLFFAIFSEDAQIKVCLYGSVQTLTLLWSRLAFLNYFL